MSERESHDRPPPLLGAKPREEGEGGGRGGVSFTIGDIRLDRAVESEGPVLDPFELYADMTPEILAANLGWLAPRFYDREAKRLIMALQGFVVRSRGRVILVDTCVGDCKPRPRAMFDNRRWHWLERLAAFGVKPEDVDTVVCTHFHVDHVGWNTRLEDGRWVPTFPNARYVWTKAEWDFWRSERGRFGLERAGDYVADSVVPIVEAGLADMVAPDHVINDEVKLLPAAGHTPGLVSVDLRSRGEHAVIIGDAMHSPVQIRFPDWSTRFCADADQSRATRRAMLERYAGTPSLVLTSHFPAPTAGYVVRKGSGFDFRFVGET